MKKVFLYKRKISYATESANGSMGDPTENNVLNMLKFEDRRKTGVALRR